MSASPSLRVLHVLDHSLPLHSGYTFRTAAILREQRRLGWQTFHLTGPKHQDATPQTAVAAPAQVEESGGFTFHRTTEPSGPLASWPGLAQWDLMKRTERRLLEVARTVRPHLIHAHSPVLNAIPALRVAREIGVPVVYEVRAFWEDAAVDHGTTTEGSVRYRLSRALETHALRQVDHVFTICEGLRGEIVSRGLDAQRVSVIPNAVDIDAFALGGQADPVLRTSLGLDGCRVLGFIGSFYAYEGLELLVAAMPGLLQADPRTRLLLVGGGPQARALQEQVVALGLQEQVRFTGRVPHEEVHRYYDLLDVLVYPRLPMRLTELVTPLKPLEAMAQGRVLVASDVGGHRELIDHGHTGLLFRAGDAQALADCVRRLLEQPDWGRSLGIKGRRFVEAQRHWAGSVAAYAPVFERLVSQRRLEVGF